MVMGRKLSTLTWSKISNSQILRVIKLLTHHFLLIFVCYEPTHMCVCVFNILLVYGFILINMLGKKKKAFENMFEMQNFSIIIIICIFFFLIFNEFKIKKSNNIYLYIILLL
jgi:heme O synthase-like polyprenyltransferase